MSDIDLNAPATLKWISKDVVHERSFRALQEAVRVAMKELRKGEFLSAWITTEGSDYRGDQIVELHQTGGVARRGYARF